MKSISAPLPHFRSSLFTAQHVPVYLAVALFLFHLLFNLWDSYGIFRDEFYYLACSKRLAWGYVDQPPLSVALLRLQTSLFGDSLVALRLLPALALAGTVMLTGRLVQRMGGDLLAVLIACIAVMLAPIYLAMGSFYSMNSLDIFLWAAVAYTIVAIVDKPAPVRWLLLGVLLGLGLVNKVGFLWLGGGLLVGILLTPLRQQLLTPWPYAAAAMALLGFLPFVLWNVAHDMAHLEFMRNALAYKYAGISRWDFVSGLFLQMNPIAFFLWLPGLYFLIFHREGRRYAILAYIFLFAFAVLLLNGHSKSEYLAPAFTHVLAAGSVWVASWQHQHNARWLVYGLLVTLCFTGIMLAPLARPVLPVETFINYSQTLGIAPDNSEGKELKALPQFYADRFGWKAMAAAVADAFDQLTPEEQLQAIIYTQNYGEAGALEYYQQTYGLPPVISGHNAYWTWGWGTRNLQVLIGVGGKQQDYEQSYEEVKLVGRHHAALAMPYEDKLPIYLCRGLKRSPQEIWPSTKNYN